MAADVLMGNDPDCGRWIRAHRRGRRPRARPARRRVNRRRGARGAAEAPTAR